MNRPIRVMVVDDSALYRKVITDALANEPAIQVVGSAPNGKIALMKIPQHAPDVLTLDMEMPEMDGLATLRELRKTCPTVKTIVFSQHSEKGAELALKAMELGALDFITKPDAAPGLEQGLESIRESLQSRIVELAGTATEARVRARPAAATRTVRHAPRDVIAIGISTGGPNSLMTFFQQVPAKLKQAILIVQHMPPIFTRKLAEQLSKVSRVPVREARDGERIVPGQAYIAPGDYHLEVAEFNGHKVVRLHQGPKENYCRPAVDVLFRSVAKHYGKRAIGVIMTGMGRDGFEGSKVLKASGAPIIAQDRESCVVWGMPRFVTEHRVADAIAPLDAMFANINQFIL